ncbi:crossover junction endonuclease MUS81 [Drosophila tropicalis]|uniref:crossover junction endonuclease MUS81 n=1 Tax=Drosophila tropicalis TaxID=46794 RepID=UPI0035ABABFC
METRLEVRLKEPNPLFTQWLQRWLEQAEKHDQKSQYKLRQALEALKTYPLPLYSGRECAILRGFGKTLCQMIDNEIAKQQESQVSQVDQAQDYQQEVAKVVKEVQKKQQQQKKPKEKKLTKKQREELEALEERTRLVEMPRGSFSVKLLVDIQETSGKNKKVLDQTRSYLESLQVQHEVRRLTVGDFLWLAHDSQGNELVLPYIVERKRMDDLASSIRDGRFHEQKHRLKQCGIPNLIYLIEDYGQNEHLGLPMDSLKQAWTNAKIQNNIQIIRTENHYRSMLYLSNLTKHLTQLFASKELYSVLEKNCGQFNPINDGRVGLLKFRSLYEDSSRSASLTVREVFLQQLLQLHSLSLERALAIVELYPTPRLLIDAFEETQDPNLLATIPCGPLSRPLGAKLSKLLYEFYFSDF